jgi:hypothetical protein
MPDAILDCWRKGQTAAKITTCTLKYRKQKTYATKSSLLVQIVLRMKHIVDGKPTPLLCAPL